MRLKKRTASGDRRNPRFSVGCGFPCRNPAAYRANLVGELRRRTHREGGLFSGPRVTQPWRHLLHERGWVAPSWPREYGGPGWSARQRYIFEAEMAAAGAPRLPAMGLQMVGPVIMKFGTPEQRAHYLPRILSGEDYWCQGYSEPNAGSDLAAVQLRAVREGDAYVLNETSCGPLTRSSPTGFSCSCGPPPKASRRRVSRFWSHRWTPPGSPSAR